MNFVAIFFISGKAIDEFFKNLDICVGFDLKVQNQRSNVLKTTFENFSLQAPCVWHPRFNVIAPCPGKFSCSQLWSLTDRTLNSIPFETTQTSDPWWSRKLWSRSASDPTYISSLTSTAPTWPRLSKNVTLRAHSSSSPPRRSPRKRPSPTPPPPRTGEDFQKFYTVCKLFQWMNNI